MKRIRFLFEAAVLGSLLGVARLLPRGLLLRVGSLAGRLGYWLDARHRRVALGNIRAAFGDAISEREARSVVRDCYRHFGRISFDTLTFPRYSVASQGREIYYEGLEHIRSAYAKGKGVLLFSGHYGHWELVALMQGFLGLPLSLVTRPLDNPLLEGLLARLRRLSGNTIIHKRNAVREILLTLRGGGGVAIVIDQDAGREGIFVPFFGRPASTTQTLALAALRTGASVVPVFSAPREDGAYRVVYEPELQVVGSNDRRADVVRLTEQCTAIIERWVRRHPELWLWMHQRWKTRPDGR